jgi:hypothetical protein
VSRDDDDLADVVEMLCSTIDELADRLYQLERAVYGDGDYQPHMINVPVSDAFL